MQIICKLFTENQVHKFGLSDHYYDMKMKLIQFCFCLLSGCQNRKRVHRPCMTSWWCPAGRTRRREDPRLRWSWRRSIISFRILESQFKGEKVEKNWRGIELLEKDEETRTSVVSWSVGRSHEEGNGGRTELMTGKEFESLLLDYIQSPRICAFNCPVQDRLQKSMSGYLQSGFTVEMCRV